MALDMFLKIGRLQGESRDSWRKGWIDVLAWSWGMSQSGSFHVGRGGGAGKANFQDLAVTKWIDKTTADLLLHVANGDHFDDAQLIVRKAGKAPLDYLIITMRKVLVTSQSIGGSGGEDRLTENISLNFAEFDVQYVEQKKDGSGEKPVEFGWDIQRNVEAGTPLPPPYVPPVYTPPPPVEQEDSPQDEDPCANATYEDLHNPSHPCYPENRPPT